MNTEKAIEKLEELANVEFSLDVDTSPATEYADNVEELVDWAKSFDDAEFVDEDFSDNDIDDYYVDWYTGQSDDRDVSAFIIYREELPKNRQIVAYGYAAD